MNWSEIGKIGQQCNWVSVSDGNLKLVLSKDFKWVKCQMVVKLAFPTGKKFIEEPENVRKQGKVL